MGGKERPPHYIEAEFMLPRNKKKWIHVLLAIALSSVLCYLLLSWVHLQEVFSLLTSANPQSVVGGALLYIAALLCHTARFHLLLRIRRRTRTPYPGLAT